jgi:hypothetical protein
MKDVLLNVIVLVAILGVSAVITSVFARAMYIRCAACGTLNAKRRTNCRTCQALLRELQDDPD